MVFGWHGLGLPLKIYCMPNSLLLIKRVWFFFNKFSDNWHNKLYKVHQSLILAFFKVIHSSIYSSNIQKRNINSSFRNIFSFR